MLCETERISSEVTSLPRIQEEHVKSAGITTVLQTPCREMDFCSFKLKSSAFSLTLSSRKLKQYHNRYPNCLSSLSNK